MTTIWNLSWQPLLDGFSLKLTQHVTQILCWQLNFPVLKYSKNSSSLQKGRELGHKTSLTFCTWPKVCYICCLTKGSIIWEQNESKVQNAYLKLTSQFANRRNLCHKFHSPSFTLPNKPKFQKVPLAFRPLVLLVVYFLWYPSLPPPWGTFKKDHHGQWTHIPSMILVEHHTLTSFTSWIPDTSTMANMAPRAPGPIPKSVM